MATEIPSDVALTTIADGSEITASPHRNNYAALQTALNGGLTALRGGTAGQFLKASDSTHVEWGEGPTIPVHTYSVNSLGADVSLASAGTWYDGPQLTLAAGTWLLVASLTIAAMPTTARGYTGRIYDGSSSLVSVESGVAAETTQSPALNLVLATVVVSAGGVTYKAQVTPSGATAGSLKAATPDNGVGNNASTLVAVKL